MPAEPKRRLGRSESTCEGRLRSRPHAASGRKANEACEREFYLQAFLKPQSVAGILQDNECASYVCLGQRRDLKYHLNFISEPSGRNKSGRREREK